MTTCSGLRMLNIWQIISFNSLSIPTWYIYVKNEENWGSLTLGNVHIHIWASLMAQLVKNLPAMKETLVRFLGWEDPLEKGYTTHSSILGLSLWLSWWRICLKSGRPGFYPWVGKIPSWRERLPTPVFWPGEFHGLCSPWGHKESDTTEQLSLSHSHIYSRQRQKWERVKSGNSLGYSLSSKGPQPKSSSAPLAFRSRVFK